MSLLALFSALSGVILGGFLWVREPISVSRRTLLLFLGACVLERLLEAVSLLPLAPSGLLWTHRFRLLAIAVQLGPLFHFSQVYARGHSTSSLRNRTLLLVVYLLPAACVVLGWPFLAFLRAAGNAPADPVWLLRLGLGGVVLHVLAVMVTVPVLLTLEQTLRASIGTMRWRVKYTVLGLAIHGISRIYLSSQEILHAGVSRTSWFGVGAVAFILTSVMIGFSLRRGHLHAIDIYPSQQVLRHSVTVLLSGLYLLVVGLLSYLSRWVGGMDSLAFRSLLVLLGVLGAAVILLSDRVRLWAKQFVAVHFQRPSYDYRQIWQAINDQTSSQTDLPAFARAAAQVISQTFEALSVSVWLVDESTRRFFLAGSTLLDRTQAEQVAPPVDQTESLVHALRDLNQPVDLNQIQAPWASTLLRAHPDSFRTGQTLCVPLRARGTTLGMFILGDRVGYRPFLTEDTLLLQTISDHLAARLLSIRLSQQLVEAKEFEAFQAMSTFFVHDLKNVASTLSLLLRNFGRHFEKPAFREDALKTMADTVDKLNRTIQQLTEVRGGLELSRQSTSLAELVGDVVDSMREVLGESVCTHFDPTPPVEVDVGQLSKVLANLLLNAREACGEDGRIEISVGRRPPWICVTVRDDGPGMTAQFLEESLFRPFHSTKKGGLGIGLFHSKHIVEAHRGRFEVESKPGLGAAFHVLLPSREAKVGDGQSTGN